MTRSPSRPACTASASASCRYRTAGTPPRATAGTTVLADGAQLGAAQRLPHRPPVDMVPDRQLPDRLPFSPPVPPDLPGQLHTRPPIPDLHADNNDVTIRSRAGATIRDGTRPDLGQFR